jgi:hypothetical protein
VRFGYFGIDTCSNKAPLIRLALKEEREGMSGRRWQPLLEAANIIDAVVSGKTIKNTKKISMMITILTKRTTMSTNHNLI